jgi:diaminopimelate epimerase
MIVEPTSTLTLGKYHGLGNDFLIAVDPGAQVDLGPLDARRLCHRHRGIGADGLIHSTRAEAAVAGGAGFTLRLWNADGGEAEMSGNGIRCLAHALADAGLVPGWGPPAAEIPPPPAAEIPPPPAAEIPPPPAGEIGRPPERAVGLTVATPAGERAVTLWPTADPAVAWGSVAMGDVTVAGDAERCNVGHGHLLVDVGNPHLVVLGPDPATLDVAALGPALEASRDGGVNVEFVTLGPGPDEVTMRVWERGVGETLACGTGSCAAAAALRHWGRVGTKVTVHQPGGAVEVDLSGAGYRFAATLAGPSERIGTCQVAWADRRGPAGLPGPPGPARVASRL